MERWGTGVIAFDVGSGRADSPAGRHVLPFGGRAGGSGPAGSDRGWRDRRRGLPFALDGGVTEPVEPPAPAAAHPPSDGPHQMADQGPQAVTPGAGRQQLVRHRAEQHPGALAPVGEAHRAVPAPFPAAGVVRAPPHRHIAVRLLAPAPGNIDAARMQPPARPQRADEHRDVAAPRLLVSSHRRQGLDLPLVHARQIRARTPARGHMARARKTLADPVPAQCVQVRQRPVARRRRGDQAPQRPGVARAA